jgi:hypothetical protein
MLQAGNNRLWGGSIFLKFTSVFYCYTKIMDRVTLAVRLGGLSEKSWWLCRKHSGQTGGPN